MEKIRKTIKRLPIKITFRYEIPEYAIPGKEELVFKPMVMNNLYNQVKSYLRINTDLPERQYGFQGWLFTSGGTGRNHPATERIHFVKWGKERKQTKRCRRLRRLIEPGRDKITLHQKLALKKRVYEAADWDGFRSAVNAHKSFGDYLIIKKKDND